MLSYTPTPVLELHSTLCKELGIRLLIKREDLNHKYVSGNKWWKLKYNLEEAKRLKKQTLLTFGGAYSNHIYATAAAAKECGFESIGIIRGEETLPLNPILAFVKHCGMHLHYVSREKYRLKSDLNFADELKKEFGDFYLIPEGGSNELAVKGVSEFARTLQEIEFDYTCVPMGTGGTLAGLISGFSGKGNITGFAVLKGAEFLEQEVRELMKRSSVADPGNWSINTAYHHGGYAKVTMDLKRFIGDFKKEYGFELDPVYTGKMMYGIFDLMQANAFKSGSTILTVHTGGVNRGATGST